MERRRPAAGRRVQTPDRNAETRVADLEAKLANPALYADADGARRAGALNKELEAARRELEVAMEKWVG